MEIGLIGLPLVGKTTFFNLLTGASWPTGITGETKVHSGSAPVPDKRLDFIAALYQRERIIYARVDFKDIPGLDPRRRDKAASICFLGEVQGADALCCVVRAFAVPEVPAYFEAVSPFREFQEILTELLLADIILVEQRLERLRSGRKVSKEAAAEVALLERCLAALNDEEPLGRVPLAPEERNPFAGYGFLTVKPVIIAVNLDEEGLKQGDYPQRKELLDYAAKREIPVIEVAAQIEAEIAELPPEDRTEFLKDLGLQEPGIARLAKAAYRCLGLLSFFTVGRDEVRAWVIREGTPAKKAAGKVHSDMERGFIRAEVFHFNDLFRLGTPAKVREAGLVRLEGKDYPVRDGDIIHFRFKV
uniref:Redox-regulated ATPase YchF n=1 Tax=Ammonifex degensii TaxID=42838 RepID=A0A7C2E2U9_9THEO